MITVENRDYHHLSHSVIGGAKRIYQHLAGPKRPRCDELFVSRAEGAYDAPLDGVAGGL
jgi:hypothetical protein